MSSVSCFKVLSLDGGGIRGVIPAAVLIELERQLRAQHNDPTLKIGECFDLISGTSTGGILALLLLAPDPNNPRRARYSAQDALDLYMQNGGEIFQRSVWQKISSADGLADEKYSAKPLEDILHKYFGDLQLKELIKPCLIPSYETKAYRPFFFTSHDAVTDPPSNYYVRDVARSTSAAPTYFEPALPRNVEGVSIESPMIDGGVFANNPAACALVEAMRLHGGNPQPLELFAVLSIGTGRMPTSLTFKQVHDKGLIGWARPVIDILMEGNAQTVDYQLKTMFASLNKPGNYLRIDGEFLKQGPFAALDPGMDNASPQNLKLLHGFGEQLAANSQAAIAQFVQSFMAPPAPPALSPFVPGPVISA